VSILGQCIFLSEWCKIIVALSFAPCLGSFALALRPPGPDCPARFFLCRNNKMVTKIAKSVVSPAQQALIDAAVTAALAARAPRKARGTAPAPANESEQDRVARVLRLQNGFRGRILRYIVGKGPGVYTYTDLHNADALSDISVSNVAACLGHISWKMQGGESDSRKVEDCGYTLDVKGRGSEISAKLVRTAPVVKAPRKPRKARIALPAPVVSADKGEVA
jgi:hypothetical protein